MRSRSVAAGAGSPRTTRSTSSRGYRCANDVSARNLQYGDKQWTRGKGFDTFCPLGDRLVPVSELGDGSGLRVVQRLNGELFQDGNTVGPRLRRPPPRRLRLERLHARAGRPDPDRHAVGHRPRANPAGVDAGRRRGRGRDRRDRRAAEPRGRRARLGRLAGLLLAPVRVGLSLLRKLPRMRSVPSIRSWRSRSAFVSFPSSPSLASQQTRCSSDRHVAHAEEQRTTSSR